MSRNDALARTKDRRRSTGERHQSLIPHLPADGGVLTIPAARRIEQARLEAAVLAGVRGLGGLFAHPLGIVRLRPEPHQLTIQLHHAPYVLWYWIQLLLPQANSNGGTDARDQIAGIPGLRVQHTGGTACLYLPGTPARVFLTGFGPRWWDHMLRSLYADGPALLAYEPDWTRAERAADAAAAAAPSEAPRIYSSVLRRLRATAGPGSVNATDIWRTNGGFRLEATDGPPCSELIRLLGTGPTSPGWTVDHQHCMCTSTLAYPDCRINFLDAATGAHIYYANAQWGRSSSPAHRQEVAALNATALA